MKISKWALAALLLFGHSAFAAPSDQTVYVVHSLEGGSAPAGGLSIIGANNAQRLASWFSSDPPADPPIAIYVTASRVAQQTAGPLAEDLGIAPKVYDEGDLHSLADAVREEEGPVLIVGQGLSVGSVINILSQETGSDSERAVPGDIWVIKSGAVQKDSLNQD